MSTATLIFSISRNLFRYGGPIVLVAGSFSCILNIIVFTKSTLRKNPCTVCLIGVNTINFLCFNQTFLLLMLLLGYGIDFITRNIFECRFQCYIAPVLSCLESSYMILASVDRTLITSTDVNRRNFSTRRLVSIAMIIMAVFWLAAHIHALIFTHIYQLGPNNYSCYYQTGVYTIIMTYYALVVNGALPPLLMAFFALWTMKNISEVRRTRLDSRANNMNSTVIGRHFILQSKDYQLVRMLLLDILIFIICKCPASFMLLYQQITDYVDKSTEQRSIEQSILSMTYFVYYIENGVSFYTNMLVSKTFRKELKHTLTDIHLPYFRH